MKPTATPVCRLTADCIWNSFHSSGKRHLILTGDRGSGKTTLLAQLFPQPTPGLTTWAEPQKAVYLRENRSGTTVQVGVFDPSLPGKENKMVPVTGGFVSLGIPALAECSGETDGWVTIDEIGYLETQCQPYCQAILALMEQVHLAAAVRKQDLPFLQQLRQRSDVFLVDPDDPFGNMGCVIMASGLGKRFGCNKLMADFRGEPLICRILAATEPFAPHRVVVTRHEDVAALCQSRGIPVILHDLPHRSDTVRLGLEALCGVERCMFCPADQPLLRAETAAALALAAANAPEFIWRPTCGGVPGAPVVFPGWAFSLLRTLPEGSGGGAVIKDHPRHLRTLCVQDGDELRDIDRPEDLPALWNR